MHFFGPVSAGSGRLWGGKEEKNSGILVIEDMPDLKDNN